LNDVKGNLQITETVDGDIVTLALSGELDEASCPTLARCLGGCCRPGARVIVDLRPLNFMDTAGVELLHEASVRSSAEGWTFAVMTTGERYISRRPRAAA
jgi:anti-anti-sigma factor